MEKMSEGPTRSNLKPDASDKSLSAPPPQGPPPPQLYDRLTNVKWPTDPQSPSMEGIQSKDKGTVAAASSCFGFSQALFFLKSGSRVCRRTWAGGNFVVVMPALNLPPYNTQGTERKVNDRTAKWIGVENALDCQAYFAIYDATTNEWQPGWLPSTKELFAEDWMMV